MYGTNKGAAAVCARLKPGSVGVEIGVWRGDSSEQFLRVASHLSLVDPWAVTAYEDSDEFGDYSAYLRRYSKLVGSENPADFQAYYDRLYAAVVERFAGQPVTVYRCTSEQWFSEYAGPVDWVYVDGRHDAAGCLADLVGAAGIADVIYGDDYGNKPGVTQAVDAFVTKTGLPFEVFAGNQYEIRVC